MQKKKKPKKTQNFRFRANNPNAEDLKLLLAGNEARLRVARTAFSSPSALTSSHFPNYALSMPSPVSRQSDAIRRAVTIRSPPG